MGKELKRNNTISENSTWRHLKQNQIGKINTDTHTDTHRKTGPENKINVIMQLNSQSNWTKNFIISNTRSIIPQ